MAVHRDRGRGPRFGVAVGVAFAAAIASQPRVAPAQAVPANTAQCLNADEVALAAQINTWRQQNGRTAVPVSFSLSSVAQWHVWDMRANGPVQGSCNLHSWSNARPAQWQGMCYTSDHAQAAQMWAKPAQITGNVYTSPGYEIAAGGTSSITPTLAINLWKNSAGHAAVVLNTGSWAGQTWRGMGVGLYSGYAVVWFGAANDPLGTMPPCAASPVARIFANGFQS